jgi:hypothetical protein
MPSFSIADLRSKKLTWSAEWIQKIGAELAGPSPPRKRKTVKRR